MHQQYGEELRPSAERIANTKLGIIVTSPVSGGRPLTNEHRGSTNTTASKPIFDSSTD